MPRTDPAHYVSRFAPGQRFSKADDSLAKGRIVRAAGAIRELMSSDTLDAYKAGYLSLWQSAQVRADWLPQVDQIIDRQFVANRARYERVELDTGIPWFFIAITHMQEGSGDFETWLANGDPLTGVTRNVPAGLGRGEMFPVSWERAADITIKHDGLDKWKDWTVAGCAFKFEGFNGFGYRSKGINSPYLWSQSNQWTSGKYVRDGIYDPSAGSNQIGAMVYLKRMHERGLIQIAGIDRKPEQPGVPNPVGQRPIVKKDDVGWFVQVAQHALNGCGYGPVTVDGEFGELTRIEVTEFQRDVGLEVDGEVGPVTWGALDAHGKLKDWKPLGSASPVSEPGKGFRANLVARVRSEALKGRSHSPGSWIDNNVMDPLRPAMVKLQQLGSSQTDNFWNWCAAWVTYQLRQAGVRVPDQFPGSGQWATVCWVEMWVVYAKSIGAWRPLGTAAPVPGDIVIYDWDGDVYSDHIGFVLERRGSGVLAAEGNRGNVESVVDRQFGIRGYIDLSILVARLTVVS